MGVGGGLLALYNDLYVETLPKRIPLSIEDRLFHVIIFLSAFDIEKLRKIYQPLAPLERTPQN